MDQSKVVTVLFGIIVVTTLNMDQSKVVTGLFGIIVCTTLNEHGPEKAKERFVWWDQKEIIAKHGKVKGYKTISKQLDVPVTTIANIIKKL